MRRWAPGAVEWAYPTPRSGAWSPMHRQFRSAPRGLGQPQGQTLGSPPQWAPELPRSAQSWCLLLAETLLQLGCLLRPGYLLRPEPAPSPRQETAKPQGPVPVLVPVQAQLLRERSVAPVGPRHWTSQPVAGARRQYRQYRQCLLVAQPLGQQPGPQPPEPSHRQPQHLGLPRRRTRGRRRMRRLQGRRGGPPQPSSPGSFWPQPSSPGPFWPGLSWPQPFWRGPSWRGPFWVPEVARRGSVPRAQPCGAHDQPGAQPHSMSGS